MAVSLTGGTKLHLGPVISSATDTEVEFAALTYQVVGETESFGDFGDKSSDVTFTATGDQRTRHLKGARDAGTITVTTGRDPLDVGQLALAAAEQTKWEYAIKVVLDDAPSDLYNPTTFYFRGTVRSAPLSLGSNDSVTKRVFEIGINSRPIEIPAELIS